jgi:hypothetical protein
MPQKVKRRIPGFVFCAHHLVSAPSARQSTPAIWVRLLVSGMSRNNSALRKLFADGSKICWESISRCWSGTKQVDLKKGIPIKSCLNCWFERFACVCVQKNHYFWRERNIERGSVRLVTLLKDDIWKEFTGPKTWGISSSIRKQNTGGVRH